MITKATVKENLGELMCLSIAKTKARNNLLIFICNQCGEDGTHFAEDEAIFKGQDRLAFRYTVGLSSSEFQVS